MNNSARIAALAATLIIAFVVVLILVVSSLTYSAAEQNERCWPPVDSSEILFANEYVAAGAVESPVDGVASPVAQSAPTKEVVGTTDHGVEPTVAQQPVSSANPSAMTANPTNETSAKADDSREREAKARAEQAREISKRVNFGGQAAGGDDDSAPKASGEGGSSSASASASVGGRSMEHWVKPSAKLTGSITVRVAVDRQGKVVRADYVSGTGAVASDRKARQNCEQSAMKSQFSVALSGPVSQIGTITYNFR